jgi:hypothetical protein
MLGAQCLEDEAGSCSFTAPGARSVGLPLEQGCDQQEETRQVVGKHQLVTQEGTGHSYKHREPHSGEAWTN